MSENCAPVLAYCFLPAEQAKPVGTVETVTAEDLWWGLEGSRRPIDALRSAQRPAAACIVLRTAHSGRLAEEPRYLCSTERTIVALADATELLHELGCFWAEEALNLVERYGAKVDPCSRAGIAAKRAWLRREIGCRDLAAARAAAYAPTTERGVRASAIYPWTPDTFPSASIFPHAAYAATGAFPCDAAWRAAEAAAYVAAHVAAFDAARRAGRDLMIAEQYDDARRAARGRQNVELERRLRALLHAA